MTLKSNDRSVQKRIDDRVKSGQYASVDHVLSAALDSLEQRERMGDFAPGEMDELCRVGLEQVRRGETLDAEDVFREIDALRDAAIKKAQLKPKTRAARGKR